MDLLSLPKEMLGNVFKFSKFETITKIRKVNKDIDALVVRCGLHKPKISRIDSLGSHDGLLVRYKKSNIFENIIGTPYVRESRTLFIIKSETEFRWLMLAKYLEKVQCETIYISEIVIDQDWLNMLNNYKDAKKVSISISFSDLNLPLDDLKSVLRKFKRRELSGFNTNSTLEGSFASDRVISSLLPILIKYSVTYRWFNNVACPDVTDKSLRLALEIAPSCFRFDGLHTNFSIDEVLQTLRKVMDGAIGTHFGWHLGCVELNTIEKLNQTVEMLKSYEHVKVQLEQNYFAVSYSPPNDPDSSFKFRMYLA